MTTNQPNHEQPAGCQVSRRDFLKLSALAGSAAAFLGSLPQVQQAFAQSEEGSAYVLAQPEHQVYSICQQCNTQCGIKVKILDGVAVKIEGNPYSPWNLVPHVAYDIPRADMAKVDAPLCPKGQAGLQAAYDPFRITQVLKRAGKRGENKWVTIPFDQAITEIVGAASSSPRFRRRKPGRRPALAAGHR
jgi:anaerobic selenocysteine-containing dehydrogenase